MSRRWVHCKDCDGKYNGRTEKDNDGFSVSSKDDGGNWCGWDYLAIEHTKETGHRNYWNWCFD